MFKSTLLKVVAVSAFVASVAQAYTPTVFMSDVQLGPAPAYALTTREGGAVTGFASASTFFEYCNICFGGGQTALNFGPGIFYQWGVAYPYALGNVGQQFQGPASTGFKSSTDATIKNVVVSLGDWACGGAFCTGIAPRTYTVALTNATYAANVDPTTTAKNVCSADVVESTYAQNSNALDGAGNHGSASGLVTYSIPASAFKCTHGKLGDMGAVTVAAVYLNLSKMALDPNGYPLGGNAFGVIVGSMRFE